MPFITNAVVKGYRLDDNGAPTVFYPSRDVNIDDPLGIMEMFVATGKVTTRVMTDDPDNLWRYNDLLEILEMGGEVPTVKKYTVLDHRTVGAFGIEDAQFIIEGSR